MTNQQSKFLIFGLFLSLLTSCNKKEPAPVKERIEGELQNLHINIYSGSVDFVSFNVRDNTDGKVYGVGMDEVNGPGFLDFNAHAYIDSTDLVTSETKIISQPSGFVIVSPVQSVNNRIFVNHTGEGDKTFKTKYVVARITDKTIVTIGDNEPQIKSYTENGGIQKYLAPNLGKAIRRGFASDIDSLQTGSQYSKFFVYNIKIRD